MTSIDIPKARQPQQLGVFVERTEIAGVEMFSVTAWRGSDRHSKRRFYTDRSIALASAAGYAENRALPLFDLTSEAE